jgi:hypothetical protein
MADVTIKTGVIHDDTGVLISVPSPMPPYRKGFGEYCEELEMGAGKDFASGDNLIFQFEGSDKILSAQITTNDGTIKTYSDDAMSGVALGRQITVSNCTTNIKADIKFSI